VGVVFGKKTTRKDLLELQKKRVREFFRGCFGARYFVEHEKQQRKNEGVGCN
jgi:hypothetical protein